MNGRGGPGRRATRAALPATLLPVRSLAVPASLILLVLCVAARVGFRPPADGSRLPRNLDVIWVTASSFRLDAVGDPASTPQIHRWIKEGAVSFPGALAQAPWTLPSLASAFTGQHPSTHGVEGKGQTLSPSTVTLAQILSSQGYATASFQGAWGFPEDTGLERGLDTVLSQPGDGGAVTRAREWLGTIPRGQHVFLHVHLGGMAVPYPEVKGVGKGYQGILRHRPLDQGFLDATAFGLYRPHPPGKLLDPLPEPVPLTDGDSRWVEGQYRAQAPALDRAFGQVLDALEGAGRGKALVILLGLHGEGLGERGFFGPGYGPYEEVVRVPMALRLPQGAVTVPQVMPIVEAIDLLPTVLDILEKPVPDGVEGRSLVPLLEGWVQGELTKEHYIGGSQAVALRSGPWKLIRRRGADGTNSEQEAWELYNLEEDPKERWNLYRRNQSLGPVGQRLKDALQRRFGGPRTDPGPVSPLTREAMEALKRRGYPSVDQSSPPPVDP